MSLLLLVTIAVAMVFIFSMGYLIGNASGWARHRNEVHQQANFNMQLTFQAEATPHGRIPSWNDVRDIIRNFQRI